MSGCRRRLRATRLQALGRKILCQVRGMDMWQRGDFDLVHVVLHSADEERVYVDRDRNDAVQGEKVVDAAEELLDRRRLFAELNDLL